MNNGINLNGASTVGISTGRHQSFAAVQQRSGMREFTDPFTGETLDDPTRKSYKVEYDVNGRMGETEINTLAEGRLTQRQAKEKLVKRPDFMTVQPADLSIESITKMDEVDRGGSQTFPWE